MSTPRLTLTPALRAAVWDEALHVARSVLRAGGLREVVTPCLVDAQALEPWIEPVSWSSGGEAGWVRTSPEIALKRAICRGAGSVFEVAAVARAGERGAQHLPEFHLLEWYRVGGSLGALRDDVETIVTTLGDALRGVVERMAPSQVDRLPAPLGRRFSVMDFAEAFAHTADIPLAPEAWVDPLGPGALAGAEAVETCLRAFRSSAGVPEDSPRAPAGAEGAEADGALRLLQAWTELFSLWSDLAWDPWLAREAAANPERRGVHLVDFPPALAALSRITDASTGQRAQRLETYVDGREIANGYDELRDSREQHARFALVARLRAAAGLSPLTPPRAFLADLDAPGLPPCVGVALGMERVISLVLGLDGVHELAFP